MKRGSAWIVSSVLVPSVLVATAALAAAGLDDGLLVPDWFPGTGEFRETGSFDYLWVKEGFTFAGRTIHVKDWEGPVWLYEKRDVKDRTKGEELTELMPTRLRGALNATLEGKAAVSREEGDLLLLGRFVDVNAGSKGAKWLVGFGAGSSAATWDLKFVDAATGEVLVSIHHRSVSGTTMSEIDDKIAKWLEEFAHAAAADFREYASGKPRKQ